MPHAACFSLRSIPLRSELCCALQTRFSARWEKVSLGCERSLSCRALAPRWEWLTRAAAGTFGRVLECWDRKNKDYVAIKIVRNVQKYRDAAMIEVCTCSQSQRGWHEHWGHRSAPCLKFWQLDRPRFASARAGQLQQQERAA